MPRTRSHCSLSTVRANVADFKTSDARSGRLAVVTGPRDRAIATRDKQPFVVSSRQRAAASANGGYAERLAGMLTETKQRQLAFWTAFAESLKTSTFDPGKAGRTGTSSASAPRAKIVLTTLTAHPGRRGGFTSGRGLPLRQRAGTRWVRRLFSVGARSVDPKLVEQREPLQVILEVADPLGGEHDRT